MSGSSIHRRSTRPGALAVLATAVVGTLALASCGSGSASSETPSTVPSAAAATAAAEFCVEDATMRELDVDLTTVGRDDVMLRLAELHGMGLRARTADLPLQYDRYVAEPASFLNACGPGTGVGMLVFEMDADDRFAYEWAIGDLDRPVPEDKVTATPSPVSQLRGRANAPSRDVGRLLGRYSAALERGDAHAAASYFEDDAMLWEEDRSQPEATEGREAIAARLRSLLDDGLRLEPAGLAIQYDVYVAQPVRLSTTDAPDPVAAIVVSDVRGGKISSQWLLAHPE